MQRIVLALVSLYLLARGGYEVARSGVLGGEAQLRCWEDGEAVPSAFVQRARVGSCHAHLGEMMYLRRDEEVVGLLVPMRTRADAGPPITFFLQTLDPAIVSMVVDDEVSLDPASLPAVAGPAFRGCLIAEDKVSEGRRLRLHERYEDLDVDFRILDLDGRPQWTDGAVMFVFGLFGVLGVRRLGRAEVSD